MKTANKPLYFRLGGYATILTLFVALPLFSGNSAKFFLHDHFFVRLLVADGLSLPTNDVSPVWDLLLTAFRKTGGIFYPLVFLTIALCGALSLFLLKKLLARLDLTPPYPFTVGAFALALFLRYASAGTDVCFAIPAVFAAAIALFDAMTETKRVFLKGSVAGLALTAMILCRFDTILFVGTFALVFYFVFNGKEPVSVKNFFKLLASLLAGLAPVIVRAVLLKQTFGGFVPETVASWGQNQGSAPWYAFSVLFVSPFKMLIRNPSALPLLTFPAVLLCLVAYHSLPWVEVRRSPRDTVFLSLIWYPVAALTAWALFTQILIPAYALYPLAVGGPVALAYALTTIDSKIKEEKERRRADKAWKFLGGVLFVLACLTMLGKQNRSAEALTRETAAFAKAHPGVYAAGVPVSAAAVEAGVKTILLDGAAGDKDLRKYLSAQTDLTAVFEHYGVDWLVAVNAGEENGCYNLREPAQNAFGTNKAMSAWLCRPPVRTVEAAPGLTILFFNVKE